MSGPLTLLYVPGDRPDRIPKALNAGADTVVVDLEDAVAPARKEAARDAATRLLSVLDDGGPGVQVRVNSMDTPWWEEDVKAAEALDPRVAVRIPKVETANQVQLAAAAFPGRELHLLIESALGVENMFAIASAHPNVASIGLGEADLRSELGLTGDETLDWIRARTVIASHAAGLGAPAMSVFAHVTDEAGLRKSCERGREQGFRGRAAIHPRQLDPIKESFRPTAEETRAATQLLELFEEAQAAGEGTVVLPNGTFVDAAMVAQAEETVALYERLQP